MFATYLSVAVLVGVAAASVKLDLEVVPGTGEVPRELLERHVPASLQYVYAFFRHGIRSPGWKPFPNDRNKNKYQKYLPGAPGQLTTVGKELMYDVGKRLRAFYGDFLGNYTEQKVYVSSTNLSRTINTGLSVMAGLYPPETPILRDLRWQPIPVWQGTDFDIVYLYLDPDMPALALEVCPHYGRQIEEGMAVLTGPDMTEGREVLYEMLRKFTGLHDTDSVLTASQIFDTILFENLNGLPLPRWAIEPQPYYDGKPIYPDLLEPTVVEYFKDTLYLDDNKEMLQFYSGPLFNEIRTHLENKAMNPRSKEVLRFHATHDLTLLALLYGLGMTKPFIVRPGDGILFELHNESHIPIVKVLYFDALGGITQELPLPRCPAPCCLSEFLDSVVALTPEEWRDRCYS